MIDAKTNSLTVRYEYPVQYAYSSRFYANNVTAIITCMMMLVLLHVRYYEYLIGTGTCNTYTGTYLYTWYPGKIFGHPPGGAATPSPRTPQN